MKAAVVLTGLVRTYAQTYKALFKFLDKNFDEYDIYISTWDIVGKKKSRIKDNFKPLNEEGWITWDSIDPLLDDIKKIYNPKVLDIENFAEFKKISIPVLQDFMKRHDHTHVPQLVLNSFVSQFYKIQRGFNLIPNEYDVVIRTRFDITINEIKINLSNDAVTVNDVWCKDRGGYQDYIAIGSYNHMKTYCNFCDFMLSASPEQIDTFKDAKKRYAPEKMMEKYTLNVGLKINTNPSMGVRMIL